MTTSTRHIRIYFGTGEGVGSGLPGLYSRNHTMSRHYDGDDGGGDGGAGAGDGGDGGAGDGGAGGEGGAEGQFYEFKDETQRFKFPGMAKAMTVKEYNEHIGKQTSTQAQTLAAQALGKIFMRLGLDPKTGQPKGKGKGQDDQPRRRQSDKTPDPLTQLESMDLVDGKSIASVLRQAQQGHIMPLAQAVVSLKKQLDEVRQGISPVVQDRDEQLFGGEVDGAIKALKLPQVPGKNMDGIHAALRELARDVFYGYDDADRPNLKGATFAKLVNERFSLLRKAFKELDGLELEAARQRSKQRIFAKPGANTSVNGKPQKRLTNRDVANALFDGVAPNA